MAEADKDERRVSLQDENRSAEGRLSKRFSSASGTTFRRESAGSVDKDVGKRTRSRAALGSIISIRRASGVGDYAGGTRTAKFMNSYKLESDKPFHIYKVECILKEVLTEAMDNLTYDPEKVPFKAKWAAGTIRQRVKDQEYDRYKLVCIVTIGEKLYQDLSSVMRFLWDVERDKMAMYTHENMHVYGAAICFGMYYE